MNNNRTWKRRLSFAFIPVLFLLFLSLFNCALYDMEEFKAEAEDAFLQRAGSAGEFRELSSNENQVTFAWDAPSGNVQKYRFYYREHGTQQWILLEEFPATSNPEINISHSDLHNGVYDLAVTAVDNMGRESSKHSSLDPSASPDTGWYLRWEK